ncbi:MAG: glycoside hydrolase family 97 protein [Prevotellaceae bacterium]|jgi:hypothetical protein|nr:glycoside hydrolase family 97 protein [Prevotellaceae bacterium]
MKQKLFILFFLSQLSFFALSAQENKVTLSSPDNLLQVRVFEEKGSPFYAVDYKGREALERSPLGLATTRGNLYGELKFISHQTQQISEKYTLNRAKKSNISYEANELACTFENPQRQRIDVVFRVSNNNVAFCYRIPQTSDIANITVERELSGFNFPEKTTAFLTPQATALSGWHHSKPSYEEEYAVDAPLGTPSKYGVGFTFPALFKVPLYLSKGEREEIWVLLSETGVSSRYCGSRLSEGAADGLYTIAFPQPLENNGAGSVSPSMLLPAQTPWRTITLADKLKPIVETTVMFDLVQPLYEPKYSYRFGRGTWSWIMWQDESMNFADQITYVNFAADLGYEFILIDALWDKNLGYAKMEELLQYCKGKGVSPFVWYNSNGFWNDAPQGPKGKMDAAVERKKEMAWLQKMGVKGIKVDFFGGDKQETMRLYEDILSDANDYGLMVIFHGTTLPRGWERMYPNYVGSEAVLASENLIFTQHSCNNEAFNACLHPFIRNAVGSMEFGGVLLNKRLNRGNNGGTTRKTGDIFQLATAVLFQNAVQMFALAPNNLTEQPAFEVDFMKTIPTIWDETVFLDGYPGKYVVLARRSGEKWYIAAINADKSPKKLTLKLDFLTGKNLIKYTDEKGLLPKMETIKLPKNNEATIEIQENGGVALTGS